MQAKAAQRMEETKQRLALTDEQVEQVKPVMESAAQQQKEILAKYGVNLDDPNGQRPRLGMMQARQMRSEIQKVNKDMLAQLDGVLTEEQLKELKKIQDERRAEMKQRIRAGR